MKIRMVMRGRTRRAEIRTLLDDYVERIGHYANVEVHEIRETGDAEAAMRKLKIEQGAHPILLDAAGKQFTSQEFARWLAKLRDSGVREIVFLCGGAEGFPESWCALAKEKISLSSLTMPHELARVMLAEQIYRAFAILAGHPYPK